MKWIPAVLCAALALTACKKEIKNDEAVQQGVIDYLNTRTSQTGLNMTAMDVSVSKVVYNNNEATATVAFKPKGGDAGGGMSMSYVLERRGDKWVVKGRGDGAGGDPHGGGMPAAPPEGGAMPPNHPPVQPSDKK